MESCIEDAVLKGWVESFAEWQTKWEVDTKRPWRTHSFRDISDRHDHHRRQTGRLEHVSKRTHGTRTKGSDRCQEDDVHFIFEQLLGTCGAGIQAQLGHCIWLIPRKRVMEVRRATDGIALDKFGQAIDRIDDI